MDHMANDVFLKRALDEGRLEEFIAQAEAEGSDAADVRQFDAAIAAILKPPQSEDQTVPIRFTHTPTRGRLCT